MRRLGGVLLVATLAIGACGGNTPPVPSAHVDEAARWCAQLLKKFDPNQIEKAAPKDLKDDYSKWRTNTDPDGAHLRRLTDYTRKACNFSFEDPPTTLPGDAVTTTTTTTP